MSQYPPIVYYRRTLQQNISIPPYYKLPTHTFTTLQYTLDLFLFPHLLGCKNWDAMLLALIRHLILF